MSALYDNQGREQPIQPQDHSGCRCNSCLQDRELAFEPAPILCVTCHVAEPEEGCDECSKCMEISELAQDAKVARYNARVAA